jgi:hypothetical protein
MPVQFFVLPLYVGHIELRLSEITERLVDLCISNSPVVTLMSLSVLIICRLKNG